MSMESGGLPCGQGDLEANADFSGTDNGMDMTKEMDLAKDLMLLEPNTSLQKAEELPVRQELVREASVLKPIQVGNMMVNEGASTSGSQDKEIAGVGKRMLYSDMLKKSDEKESAYAEHRRKNVVRLRFLGEDIPSREYMAKTLLIESMNFTLLQVFALIHISGSREYDISFWNGVYQEKFWEKYNAMQHNPNWKDFIAVRISQANIKMVTILFKNESVPSLDILYWLQQNCTVLGGLEPIYDKYGFGVGGYKVRVCLQVTETGIKHLPNIINIGRDRGFLFYGGQHKVCHKCGSNRHLSSDCSKIVCAKCGQQGHLSAECGEEVLCNLCKKKGHLYLKCPNLARNYL
ncbi:cbp/p300-interacting transactivator 2 isoform X1 [Latimeria chalumnae]|uniref:cbp/p300-interacting transactivator 2 isoform X1 n=1 Tax=Latimeria chalumnae TaxID=7897 RepID=UPI00313CF5C3